jgi:hypothetical protein
MKDLFSRHASSYATFRPTYPPALYEFLLKNTVGRDAAWDCACGNGQVAKDLAPHFKVVHATDISQKQLDNAYSAGNIKYGISPAERTAFAGGTFDLITVGQALHWLKRAEFYAEARRVGKPGSTIALWGYGLLSINSEVDKLIDDFYVNIIGPYWEPERKLIDDHYSSIEFPFERVQPPKFDFSFDWTLAELKGYLSTWSAVQKYIKERNDDPVQGIIYRLKLLWKQEKLRVTFPLFVLLGKI